MSTLKELELDYETRSEADLKRIGPYLYALHPSTEVLCVSWALGDEEPKIWWPDHPKFSTGTLEELVGHLLDEEVIICAHNAGFERCITRFVLSRYVGLQSKSNKLRDLEANRFQCSAAQAAAVAIPRSLEGASLVMGLSEQKDMDGNRLVKKYMKPRPAWRKWKATRARLEPKKYYDDDFELMAIGEYCIQDVKVERLLKKSLPPLTPYERLVWLKNQEMNSHGFSVDTEAVEIIRNLMRKEVKRLERELVELTDGAVTTAGQRDKFIEWLRTRGVEIPNLRAKVVEEFLKDETLEPKAKRALKIRAMVSKTSNKKYHVLSERVGPDGRVRDLALYHGASTGRETGTGFQPHNLPRGTIEVSSDYAIDIIKETKDLEEIEFLVGPPFEVFSSSIRGMIKATDGYEIIAADLNAIECRVLNWVAGNEDVLEAFRNNEDPYRKMASRIFGEPMDSITSSQRFLGKTAELGCLAPDTEVLTDSGYKKLIDINLTDKLWDGVEWINHEGVKLMGRKPVIKVMGVEATEDHLFMLKNYQWLPFASLAENRDSLRSAIEAAQLPLGVTLSPRTATASQHWQSRAHAVGLQSIPSRWVTSGAVNLKAAIDALKKTALRLIKDTGVTPISYLTTSIARDFLTAYLLLSVGAIRKLAGPTVTTAVEVLKSLSLGEKTALNFLAISPVLGAGIDHRSKWTASTLIKGTSPVTYASLLNQKTVKIKEAWPLSVEKSKDLKLVYDIVNAGPRNRFTIKCEGGHLIAHNCGYQMGADRFYQTCIEWGVPDVTEDLAKLAVKVYRESHSKVVRAWGLAERAATEAILKKGTTIKVLKCAWHYDGSFLWCQLPSGRSLAYKSPSVRMVKTPWGDMVRKLYYWSVDSKTKKWKEQGSYGGHAVENICQGIARDVTVSGILNISRAGYRYLFQCHDEIISEKLVGTGSVKEFVALMTAAPPWAKGLPISAEGWSGPRYKK